MTEQEQIPSAHKWKFVISSFLTKSAVILVLFFQLISMDLLNPESYILPVILVIPIASCYITSLTDYMKDNSQDGWAMRAVGKPAILGSFAIVLIMILFPLILK